MDFSVLIEKKRRRFEELEDEIGGGLLFENATRAREILRENARLKELMAIWKNFEKTRREIEESRAHAADDDSETAELAAPELPELERRVPTLKKDLEIALPRP